MRDAVQQAGPAAGRLLRAGTDSTHVIACIRGAKFLIRNRDMRYPPPFDTVLQAEGIKVIQTGVQMPRMNAITERWVRSCRTELLDRTLISPRRHPARVPTYCVTSTNVSLGTYTVIAATFSLNQAAQAQEELSRRGHVGKIVMHP
ncbi:hypothetical protein [Streptomyces sp. PRh5]|uniref:hypothetical protein n=1 Tax=Streptomyces sp. PRh5 TaxID=1158056 RepID=UPI0004B4E7F0|nr:hypothetical protein [Streptomyces sp. PRh5]